MQLCLCLKIVAACIPHQNIIRSFIIERNVDLSPDRFLLKTYANLKKIGILLSGTQGSVSRGRMCRMMTTDGNQSSFSEQVYASQMLQPREKYRVGKGCLKLGQREVFTGWSSKQGSLMPTVPTHAQNSPGG